MQLNSAQQKFRKQVTSFGFNFFLFTKLPAAFFAGVRVKHFNDEECAATVPYKWLSQNPFKSTYFACLAMAAELSTGLPAMMAITGEKPSFSMLVVSLESTFSKKADNVSTFICKDTPKFLETIERAKASGEGETIKSTSIGYNKQGDEVARFHITWSFKQKSK